MIKGQGLPPVELCVYRTLANRFRSTLSKDFLAVNDGPSYEAVRDRLDPSSYTDLADFEKDYLLASLLKKWEGWEGFNPKRKAIDAWIGAEHQCALTNSRVDASFVLENANLVMKTQKVIEDIIGTCPHYRRIYDACRMGSGATYDVKRRDAQVHHKLDEISTTEACLKHAGFLTGQRPERFSLPDSWIGVCDDNEFGIEFKVVRGNRGVLVPKSAKTDRPIACEPTLNSFIQQGVGRFFKERLLRVAGVDLYDQTVNQRMANFAHLIRVSTLDLSSASDTLCYNVVKVLLPPEWFAFLCDLRSPVTTWYDDDGSARSFKLEKFSAMGNAYTFELETLIFYALCIAICGDEQRCRISVYGDDMIVPQENAEAVIGALTSFGFIINQEKSFVRGSFFESCGKHYFEGVDVTPAHHSGLCSADRHNLILLHNRLYRWGHRNRKMNLVRDALKILVLQWDLRVTPKVPPGSNDIGFYSMDVETNRNGDFRAWVYTQTSRRTVISDDDHASLYFYWQRTSLSPHSDDLGHQGYDMEGRRRLCKSRIWRSTLDRTFFQ